MAQHSGHDAAQEALHALFGEDSCHDLQYALNVRLTIGLYIHSIAATAVAADTHDPTLQSIVMHAISYGTVEPIIEMHHL